MLDEKKLLDKVIDRIEYMRTHLGDKMPCRSVDGVYDDHTSTIDQWTIGFWPGLLWLAYEKTGDEKFRQKAEELETRMDRCFERVLDLGHDVGFMWLLSAKADYRNTQNPQCLQRCEKAAALLAARYNPQGNFLRAWRQRERAGWAIIDCMMNLPILYWASEYFDDPRFSLMAQKHSETVMQHFIRPDGSVKHICVFDPHTGEYLRAEGGQGYSPESSWTRGTAWALYGFALGYKYTGRQDFLDCSRRISNFFIAHLPADAVPYGDFLAPVPPDKKRDTSAATIAASGLLVLSRYVQQTEADNYVMWAKKMLQACAENYMDTDTSEAILTHGLGAYASPTQNGTIFGDYFFMEALMQLNGYKELF